MRLIELYQEQIIATTIIFVTAVAIRWSLIKVVKKTAAVTHILDRRRNLVIKYMGILVTMLTLISLFVVWGVKAQNVLAAMSAVVTVIGIAFFAQWSILSNITSGIILFFFFPFRIGDIIQIHDKDFPIQAEIEDIKAFHVYLKTEQNQKCYTVH